MMIAFYVTLYNLKNDCEMNLRHFENAIPEMVAATISITTFSIVLSFVTFSIMVLSISALPLC